MLEGLEAHVVHRAEGRLRLRVPEARGKVMLLEQIRDRITEMPGVDAVSVNGMTGSILIQGPAAEAAVDRLAAQSGMELRSGRLPGHRRLDLGGGFSETERRGLRNLLAAGLFAAGLVQVARGQILAPAVNMFWFSATLLFWSGGGRIEPGPGASA